jgi:hypothetical protein
MRRGTLGVDQMILIMFFALLLIFAIALLAMESKKLQTDRPQLTEDLTNQEANAFLVSLMRTKVLDDARLGDTNFADVIIMNNEGAYDQFLLNMLQATTPDGTYIEIHIQYPSGRIVILRNALLFGKGVGISQLLLPGKDGNTRVSIAYSKDELLKRYGVTPPSPSYTKIETNEAEAKKSEDYALFWSMFSALRGGP